MQVTDEQKRKARKANLYDFLIKNHADAIITKGDTIRLLVNHSVCIKMGYSGFYDFATAEKGNGIDLLTKYFGYDFQSAVIALCGDNVATNFSFPSTSKRKITEMEKKKLILPKPATDYKRMLAYLTQIRHLPVKILQKLINDGLLYEADVMHNAVFVNRKRDFAELRGTLSQKCYHGILAGSRKNGCWWFFQGDAKSDNTKLTYVCESAIDAISLAVLRNEPAYYISIAGAGKQAAIDNIKSFRMDVVIATDNDQPGDECRRRNQDCKNIRPKQKDWNDDLLLQK